MKTDVPGQAIQEPDDLRADRSEGDTPATLSSFSARCARMAFGGLVAILAVTAVRADWNPDEPAKWVQNPDITPTGMDVRDWKWDGMITGSRTLADDWECRVTGNITNIHIWGSWTNDLPSEGHANVGFVLAIHADIPAGTGGVPYSRPGSILWSQAFQPSSYQWRVWEQGIDEGWCDPYPPPGQYQFPGDHVCFQYNFPITNAWFKQQGTPDVPVVYMPTTGRTADPVGRRFRVQAAFRDHQHRRLGLVAQR